MRVMTKQEKIEFEASNFHYDQQALYFIFIDFQRLNEGIEVTENDILTAWKLAKKQTSYFVE